MCINCPVTCFSMFSIAQSVNHAACWRMVPSADADARFREAKSVCLDSEPGPQICSSILLVALVSSPAFDS